MDISSLFEWEATLLHLCSHLVCHYSFPEISHKRPSCLAIVNLLKQSQMCLEVQMRQPPMDKNRSDILFQIWLGCRPFFPYSRSHNDTRMLDRSLCYL